MNDARITSQPESSGERSTSDDLPPLPSLVRRRPPVWTLDQITFTAAHFLIPFVLFMIFFFVNRDYVSILYTHPIGIKMLIMALGLTVLGAVIYLAITFALNRVLRDDKEPTRRYQVLCFVFALVHFIVFIFPSIYVVIVGPAAIQIMESMNNLPPGP
jgi:hypothetical protein